MKEKFYHFLTMPAGVVLVLLMATLMSFADRNFGYFFGIGIVLFIARENRWNWSIFGFGKKIDKNTILKSLWLTALVYIGVSILIEPFLEMYFGKINLSSVDDIRGDFGNYLILMVIMWIFAAVGEELLFRGYYMKGFARLFGNTNQAWLLSAVLISVYFGLSHAYQGTAGMIAVGITGFCFSMIFYKNRENLALAALVHGFYDTIGLTLIYYNEERIFADWIEKMFNT